MHLRDTDMLPTQYRLQFSFDFNERLRDTLDQNFDPATAALFSYHRVSASSSSDFDATHAAPCIVISRFQNGARDFK
ncbi:MAG: hypothetical protein ACI9KK_000314 [Ascidiaceihabitans sp.]|jgi:hypothetical protein